MLRPLSGENPVMLPRLAEGERYSAGCELWVQPPNGCLTTGFLAFLKSKWWG